MSEARKFRKKPVVVEAAKYWQGLNRKAPGVFPDDWPVGLWLTMPSAAGGRDLIIPTPEGDHRATHGDWIIRGVKGEFYPCKPDIFAATYEAVDGAPASSQEKP